MVEVALQMPSYVFAEAVCPINPACLDEGWPTPAGDLCRSPVVCLVCRNTGAVIIHGLESRPYLSYRMSPMSAPGMALFGICDEFFSLCFFLYYLKWGEWIWKSPLRAEVASYAEESKDGFCYGEYCIVLPMELACIH